MNPIEGVRLSKFLSYVLRHRPGSIGIELDQAGWVAIDQLMECAAADGTEFTRQQLDHVVATNDKQRFEISADGSRIRASQGHSVEVALGLEPRQPPDTLYHGSASKFWQSIRDQGLRPRKRHHVHLSSDIATALRVGKRHGDPVVLRIDAARMQGDGHAFYRSENGVWLTDRVPPEYFESVDDYQP